MKNVLLLLLIFSSTISCNSDESASFSEAKLIGKWNLSGGTINGGVFIPYSHKCNTEKDFQEFF